MPPLLLRLAMASLIAHDFPSPSLLAFPHGILRLLLRFLLHDAIYIFGNIRTYHYFSLHPFCQGDG